MNYKQIVNKQIEIIQNKQNDAVKCCLNRPDIICLYANTIAKLAEIASNLKNQPIEATKGVKKDGKEQKSTTEK